MEIGIKTTLKDLKLKKKLYTCDNCYKETNQVYIKWVSGKKFREPKQLCVKCYEKE